MAGSGAGPCSSVRWDPTVHMLGWALHRALPCQHAMHLPQNSEATALQWAGSDCFHLVRPPHTSLLRTYSGSSPLADAAECTCSAVPACLSQRGRRHPRSEAPLSGSQHWGHCICRAVPLFQLAPWLLRLVLPDKWALVCQPRVPTEQCTIHRQQRARVLVLPGQQELLWPAVQLPGRLRQWILGSQHCGS